MKIIGIFIVLSLINVVFSTVRSLVTINGGKTVAAVVNAAYFAYYNVVLIFTVADFPLWVKCLVTFGANLIGVYVVKYFEEKNKPIKLWKVELALKAIDDKYHDYVKSQLATANIECNYMVAGKWVMFNCYCDTKDQVKLCKRIAKRLDGRISAYESAPL